MAVRRVVIEGKPQQRSRENFAPVHTQSGKTRICHHCNEPTENAEQLDGLWYCTPCKVRTEAIQRDVETANRLAASEREQGISVGLRDAIRNREAQ